VTSTDSALRPGPALGIPVNISAFRLCLAFIALTKPRIIETLLVTTVPTMFLAAGGLPPWILVGQTLIGGFLAAGGANALNCFVDRDIDRLMRRTQHRPLVTGAITPRAALVFGLTLGCAAVIWFALVVNLLAAFLAALAIVFYVVVYTMVLKRRTAQNIVWGGAAGCMQVLIGWSAVTGSLDWPPLVLFGIIFLWTPPHYWPLSMRFERDYAAAGVPMLPVVVAAPVVARQIVRYSWAMVACTLLLIPVARMGVLYSVGAVLLGSFFIFEAYQLLARSRRGLSDRELNPMRLFHYSITYISLVFCCIALDPLVMG
jgi:heme o synthase